MTQPQQPFPDEMRSRMPASAIKDGRVTSVSTPGNFSIGQPAPKFLITIPAADGTELVRLTEENGRLVITGDESRWDEGAKRFLHGMMQWAGLVGIRWKDEVKAAVED